jgi:hypothetical protein
VTEILVPFAGDGSGTGELTWSQRNIWRMMENFGSPVMVGGTMPLAEGTTVDHIVRLLSFIVSRHHSLRTRIHVQPDGTPVQVLAASGDIALEIVDTDDDPAEVAEAIRERFENSPFDIEKEWPVRMAVIRTGGVPSWFTAMYPHMAIDGFGFEALTRDLANLDQVTGEQLGPRAGIQPMDLARQQQSPYSRRQSDSSMRYWEHWLRTIPARRFNGPYPARDPRWSDVTYDSPAAYLAVATIADRTGLNTGPILLAAYAVAMSRVTDLNPSVIRTLVSNRFRPNFGESVSVLVQPSLCVIDVADVADASFDEVARRAWQSQFAAGKHGYYDPRDLWALLDRVNTERGVEVDLMCYFNDGRRALTAPRPGPLPTADEIRAAVSRSTLEHGPGTNVPDVKCVMDVNPVPDTINFLLRVDTQAVSIKEQETIVRAIDEILVAGALAV